MIYKNLAVDFGTSLQHNNGKTKNFQSLISLIDRYCFTIDLFRGISSKSSRQLIVDICYDNPAIQPLAPNLNNIIYLVYEYVIKMSQLGEVEE